MKFARVFAIMAAAVSVAFANDDVEGTTTLTSTLTKTLTVTKCNPTVTNCPAHETSAIYPLSNSSSIYYPTGTGPVTVVVVPTTTSVVVVTASTTESPSTVLHRRCQQPALPRGLFVGAVVMGVAALL